jgi:hypothetical protein
MARKLLTVGGRGIYARRKSIVLPEIGQSSTRGFRSFLLRGLMNVKGNASLMCTTHNIFKLYASTHSLVADAPLARAEGSTSRTEEHVTLE